jgi:hypothetical protein
MLKFNINTPVLFLVFNRPDTTNRVFEAIKLAKPKKLYIAADGARTAEEEIMCTQVRAIFKNTDWDCDVKTLFRTENLGCKIAVSEAINWFFDNEEEGIILEDDCLPGESFFGFCSTLLEKYRNNDRIGHIGGANFQDGNLRGQQSYYFSRLTHVWGWASWRRVWQNYDVNIASYPNFNINNEIKNVPSHNAYAHNWLSSFEGVYTHKTNTWDYQYAYANLVNNYLSIIPNKNLVVNIGLGNGATHTSASHPFANMVQQNLTEITHPQFYIANLEADLYSQNKEFYVEEVKKSKLSKLWKKIKNAIKHK